MTEGSISSQSRGRVEQSADDLEKQVEPLVILFLKRHLIRDEDQEEGKDDSRERSGINRKLKARSQIILNMNELFAFMPHHAPRFNIELQPTFCPEDDLKYS